MPSPTVNTRLANEEVLQMFDQTIHGGKVRDSDSESDDESDEEGEIPIQTVPTPLPARPATAAMLAPVDSAIPPTPTPASGYITQNRPLTANIFSDENAVPPSATKPGKINIFSETPSKAPVARTPLASSSKPRAFGVFQEEPIPPRPVVPVFATPALSEKTAQRRGVTEAIPEESEDDDELLHRVIEEHHVNINDEDDEDDDHPPRRSRFNIHEMTPITERTCEFTTQMTTTRSSHSGFGTNSTRRSSDVIADEAFVISEGEPIGLSAVVEEEDRPSSRLARISESPDPSALISGDVLDTSPQGHRSGSVDSGFQLPEGFTIHEQVGHTAMSLHTMVLVDGTETMHTARSASPDPCTEVDAFVTASARPGELPNPCNPAEEDVIATLLATIDPPLSALPGFADHRATTSNRLDALQKHAKAKIRRASASSRVSAAADEPMSLDLAGRAYEIKDKIGEGGFGAVFLAVDVAARAIQDEASDDEDDDDEAEDGCLMAIKVEKPGSVWEAVVLDRIHSRLDEKLRSSIIRPRSLFSFADESFLLLDYSSQGTLLDLVNKASQIGLAPAVAGAPSAVDELIAIFFTIELLKIVESLHRANFIHGDLKIDNCLVRLESIPSSSSSSAWSPNYTGDGSDGWSSKGVRLIDFGRAIDLDLFPAGKDQTFVADWKTDERDCVEMREARPWSFQTDYFGLASVCYCLLFGKYIVTEIAPNPPGTTGKRYKIATPLKRVCPLLPRPH